MRPENFKNLNEVVVSLFEPPPKETASEWCQRSLVIPPPSSSPGPLSFGGREYMREIVDSFRIPAVADIVLCFGSQTGKTTALMAGLAAVLRLDSTAAIWAMPNVNLAKSFSKTRWMPMFDASPGLRELRPTGARRHDFAALEQRIGASQLNFIGTNSAANLASRPAQFVILDEVDKFNEGSNKEADAVTLVEQRTKDFANPKRIKASTPTVSDGLIWQEYLKGDQRRFFVPCPFCAKRIVLAWAKGFAVLREAGCEAYVTWDKDAKRMDGTWDFDRVRRSARVECPHCGGHVTDGHKTRMIRDGEWRPTSQYSTGTFRSYHLPSLYAASPSTGFGALAVKFLLAKKSLLGVQGFINGELAEPWESQELGQTRTEIIVSEKDAALSGKTVRLLAADFQAVGKRIWWVCRDFTTTGNSRLVEFGTCEEFGHLREVQLRLEVLDSFVGIDSGHEASTVYQECLRWGVFSRHIGRVPEWVGWFPMKGREETAVWTNQKTGQRKLYTIAAAPLPRASYKLPLLEFNGPSLKDIMERLRRGKTEVRWEVTESVTEEYWRHMDSEVKKPKYDTRSRRIKSEWHPRSKHWPNHWKDCELELLAIAMSLGFLTFDHAKHDDAKP